MTDKEANEIIDETIKPLWPDWNISDAELLVWVRKIRKYDRVNAKAAIADYYASKDGGYKKPKLAGVLATISAR